jgi:hypothetical protein
MNDLDQQLRRLAAGIDAPETPVAEDLARGRRRVRRTRLATAGAVLGTVAVIGVASTAAPGLVGADSSPRYAGGGTSPSPTAPDTTSPAQPDEVEVTPSGDPRYLDPELLAPGDPEDTARTLAAWQAILAEHLDPGWQHLVKYDSKTNGNVQAGSNGGAITSLGSKYGWRNDGEAGLGMLQISVNADWDQLFWLCGTPAARAEGWSCHDARAPGGLPAQVADHGGVREVAVQHADGVVVVLSTDSLFGNNSTVAVSGIDVSERDLVRAAADDRITLPGGVPSTPPLLDRRDFEELGRGYLLADGEELAGVDGTGGSNPWVQGRWVVEGQGRGDLEWDATPRLNDQPSEPSCLAARFTGCTLRTVDGEKVLIGDVRAKWGGGWEVAHTGPSYAVRVSFTPASDQAGPLPVDRAVAFVLADQLQPTG